MDGGEPSARGDALRGTPPPPELRLYSDASRSGWGAHLLDQSASGLWPDQETSLHINILEMKALFLALQTFRDVVTNQRVTAMCDNSTVVAYVCKQGGGGDSLRLPLRVDRATSLLDRSPQRTPGSKIPSRTIERPRGSSQPLQPSTSGGMVPAPTGSKENHPHLGIPDDRPIRNTPQCEASPVLLTDFRPSGCLRRCLPPPVESSRRIRVPTVQSGRQGGGQSQRDPKSLHDSDRPPLAGEVLVHRPPPPADPTPPDTTTVGPPSAPTPLPSVPRRRPRPEPSRVETVKRLLQKSGLSRRASRQLSLCVREFTARLYQSQWLSFCGWCRGRSITPIDATIPVIVDFLIHLREDKGFSLSALKGYRSTINSVFTLKGLDLANSKELSMLFRTFAKTCSPQDLRTPAWDVALVLQSLTNQPYEW